MSNTTLDTITANIALMEARLQRAHSMARDALASKSVMLAVMASSVVLLMKISVR